MAKESKKKRTCDRCFGELDSKALKGYCCVVKVSGESEQIGPTPLFLFDRLCIACTSVVEEYIQAIRGIPFAENSGVAQVKHQDSTNKGGTHPF